MQEAVKSASSQMRVDLSRYDNAWYCPQRGIVWRLIWHVVSVLIVKNQLNISSRIKTAVLRLFGARIGQGVVIKPGVNIKYPWHLQIGDHAWIGEDVWLDCLVPIRIGSHTCISQGAYLCTGNHDWTDPSFGLIVKPIEIEAGAWVGAKAVILPGAHVASHAVVGAGSVISSTTKPYMIYAGNPAVPIKERAIKERAAVTYGGSVAVLTAPADLELEDARLRSMPHGQHHEKLETTRGTA